MGDKDRAQHVDVQTRVAAAQRRERAIGREPGVEALGARHRQSDDARDKRRLESRSRIVPTADQATDGSDRDDRQARGLRWLRHLPCAACVRVAYATLIGSERCRVPVAANSAFTSAGAIGGTPGSPTPAGSRPWAGTSSTCVAGGFRHAQQRVVVEVALRHHAIGHVDLAEQGERQPEHDRAFHLRDARVGVHVGAAVQDDVGVRHSWRAVHDAGLQDRRHVGTEAVVDREPKPGAFRSRPIPFRQRANPLNDVAQTPDVQPVALRRLHARNIEHAALRQDLQAVLDRIAPGSRCHLVGEDVRGEGVEDVAHGTHPTDAHAGTHAGKLHALVLDRVGQVGEAHLEFPIRRHGGTAVEHGGDGRKCRALQPGLGMAAFIDRRTVVLRARRMEVVVADVVLARPLHADRAA